MNTREIAVLVEEITGQMPTIVGDPLGIKMYLSYTTSYILDMHCLVKYKGSVADYIREKYLNMLREFETAIHDKIQAVLA